MSKVIILHPTDNVGTAVADLAAGEVVGAADHPVTVCETVPFGHKVALTPIKAGETILKYGESIGLALVDIPQGGCIHVHNVESQRGRGDLGVQA